jgi:glucokinase
MILGGDLGGTKTLLGLFEPGAGRPRPVALREFVTLQYDGLATMIQEFLASGVPRGTRIGAAAIGLAGPVRDQEVELTNVPWHVSARDLMARTGVAPLVLLNDVEAMAHSVEALAPDEKIVLQEGLRHPGGNGALISVGTGVGMAVLHRVDEHFLPVPSEGGHADFPARTERDIALLRALRPRFGRVEIERVLSGPGLANVARFTHGGACPRFPPGLPPQDEPAEVTRAGLSGDCLPCREALDIFVEGLGATAGNLALTTVATGGFFIGGGVPGKILPALQSGRFLSAFLAKPPAVDLLRTIPITVITLAEAGLLGAAVYANTLHAAARATPVPARPRT